MDAASWVVFGLVAFFLYWTAPAVLWAALFSRERPISSVPSPPDRVLGYLAYRLRASGLRVVEAAGGLDVRLGNSASVRLFARPSPEGTSVSYRPSMTKSGMSTFLVLTVLFWPSVVAAVFVVAVRLQVRRAVRSQIQPMVPPGRPLPEVRPTDEIAVLLVNGLGEEHRMAAEAFEAQRSRYWDLHGYNVLAALAIGIVTFFLLFSTSTSTDFDARVQDSLVAGLLVAVAFGIPVAVVIRVWRHPDLLRHRDAAERMRQALAREDVRQEGPASTFETIAVAAREIPAWIEAKRRAGLSGDPVAGLVLLVMGVVAVYAAWYAVDLIAIASFLPAAGIAAVFAAVVAGIVIVAGYVYHRRWKRRRDQEIAQTVAEWTRRFEALRLRMERFLDGL